MQSEWTVFGLDQQIIARLKFGNERPCFTQTWDLARGYYLVRILGLDLNGQRVELVKHMLIE